MVRLIVVMMAILFPALQSHASTVLMKRYGYCYESTGDVVDGRQFVICEKQPRTPLAAELSFPSIALRFGTDPASALEAPEETEEIRKVSSLPVPEISLEKTVHFPFDSSDVRNRKGLSLLTHALESDPTLTGVGVKGFTFCPGGRSCNDRLALRGAEAVTEIPGAAGFRVVEIAGEGKRCYAPGARRNYRRAEIPAHRTPGKDGSDEK
jgi:outer membrane protein OmpA-like peptidoglycan-associated protein